MTNYINENLLYKELIISQGKGKLTSKASAMLVIIPKEMIKRIPYYHTRPIEAEDVIQGATLRILEFWKRFNCKKYDKAFPYFSEIAKRQFIEEKRTLNGKIRTVNLDSFHSLNSDVNT